MKKIFSILAMVAALALVGCAKDSDADAGDAPFRFSGAQWYVEEEGGAEPTSTSRSDQDMPVVIYDMGYSAPDAVLCFKPGDNAEGTTLSVESIQCTDSFEALYDVEGDEVSFMMSSMYNGNIRWEIEVIDNDHFYMSAYPIKYKCTRVKSPYKFDVTFHSDMSCSLEGKQWQNVSEDGDFGSYVRHYYYDIGLHKPNHVVWFDIIVESTNPYWEVGEMTARLPGKYLTYCNEKEEPLGIVFNDGIISIVDEDNADLIRSGVVRKLKRIETPYDITVY